MAKPRSANVELLDVSPNNEAFLADVLDGLAKAPKELSCKYFYDQNGSQLFDRICETPEYYPTRTELKIMRQYVGEMADAIGPRCALIEYGSGSSLKTGTLLAALKEPAVYVPVDISREHLLEAAGRISASFPGLMVAPVCADFHDSFDVPVVDEKPARRVAYFPGSTIGNVLRTEAVDLLKSIRAEVGDDGALLIGVDLKKDAATIERAYNDAGGVSAAFNLNILTHINRELGATFNLDDFEHRADYSHDDGRMEMRLRCKRRHTVKIADREFTLEAGEEIHTEHSHKYSIEEFAALAGEAGFKVEHVWTDEELLFSVQLLVAA